MPSAKLKENHVISLPLFSLPLEKLWWLSWSPWKQHDSDGSQELLFKPNCLEKKSPSEFLFSYLAFAAVYFINANRMLP